MFQKFQRNATSFWRKTTCVGKHRRLFFAMRQKREGEKDPAWRFMTNFRRKFLKGENRHSKIRRLFSVVDLRENFVDEFCKIDRTSYLADDDQLVGGRQRWQ